MIKKSYHISLLNVEGKTTRHDVNTQEEEHYQDLNLKILEIGKNALLSVEQFRIKQVPQKKVMFHLSICFFGFQLMYTKSTSTSKGSIIFLNNWIKDKETTEQEEFIYNDYQPL